MERILKIINQYLRNKSFGCFSKQDRKKMDLYIQDHIGEEEFDKVVSKLQDKDIEDILELRYKDKQKYDFIALELFLTPTVVKEKVLHFKYYLLGTMIE